MIFSVFITVIFAAAIIKKNYKNKYSWIFSLLFVSVSFILSSILMYINKISVYRSLFQIENSISFRLNDIQISFYDVHNIIKFGMAALLFSKLCFYEGSGEKRRVQNIVFLTAAAFLCVIYYIANSFFVLERLYRLSFTNNGYAAAIKHIIEIYNFVLIITSFVLPYMSLFKSFVKTPIRFKKKQYKVIAEVTAALDVLLLFIMIGGPYRNTVNANLIVNSSYEITHWYIIFYTLLPIIFFALLTVIYVQLMRYDVLASPVLLKWRIRRNIKLVPKDMRCLAHSFKNSFFSVKIIAEQMGETTDENERRELLEEIDTVAAEGMKKAEDVSNIFGEQILNIGECSLKDIAENALRKTAVQNAEVRVFGADEKIYILADADMIAEALKNIIRNASEAIAESGRKDGIIEISLQSDNTHACISIRDNGCGISKKMKRKIFNPFFSTKKTHNNWGIGLSYANDIITAHLGKTVVDSREGEYTDFQIIFPLICHKTKMKKELEKI